ncbi:MBL fold metallo-hydrolase [Streptomyces sp. DSM 44917]|uniref:MBL fold metallo-hydrolase n=1 Tax=Streptomyces boetiae TaxID=3075541 RepID=A0ABU2L4L1_9ACTN|nr:MBL fold metallo-hydrolase [Streptomyces sp. DSM 44917]MDT0306497.1 MBL fold metallo-hydrolase [Streptomyces sp. DSM 44917]
MDAPPQHLEEIADGVHAHLQPDGSWCLSNAGLLVRGSASLLVDTAATGRRARRLRELVAGVTAEPPRLLVNTHFHGDHVFGNSLFPEAAIVAHENARIEMAAAGLALTKLWPEVGWGDIAVAPPTVTAHDGMRLHVGGTRVELLHFGPAHTTGDTAVWLPEESVLFAGDLVMSGVTPFCPMGSAHGTLRALRRLAELRPRTVVPGHGPVAGPELLELNERYLTWLVDLARTGLAAGLTPSEVARDADLGEFAALLDAERLVPNLHRAYAEERGAPPGAPLDMVRLHREMEEFHGGPLICRA